MNTVKLVLLLLLPLGIFAQEQGKKTYNKEFKLNQYAPIYVSYYGNFITHPGVKLGFDWNLCMVEKTKENRRKIKTIRKILLVTPNIAFYKHSASHKGLFLSTDLAWRRYSKNLFYSEISLGISYFRKFNSGETWEMNDNGTVTNIGSTSRGYFAPSVSFAFGKHFSCKNTTPISVFTKLNTNAITGYNSSTIVETSLELGVRMSFNWGIVRGEINTITKRK